MKSNFFITAALLALAAPAWASDCEHLYTQHLAADLALSYEQFDQTMDAGFRSLSTAGCHRQAADLIEAYIAEHDAPQRSLRWHVAQLRAMDGDSGAAVASARSVLSATEDFTTQPLRWNDYVLATIAFLEQDRAALQFHRDQVALGVDAHQGNAMNLRLLDSLLRHFDHSYAYAMQHIEESPESD
jgi:hypothetical protein